jgi:hypothetical protein
MTEVKNSVDAKFILFIFNLAKKYLFNGRFYHRVELYDGKTYKPTNSLFYHIVGSNKAKTE